ncbi:tellurium resistance protein TerY [Spirochaetia bacterium]|nr:tellurium resistance protein TerY [Spirochaetia bacterium]
MGLTDKVEIPRRTMVLFFVIDTSGSMGGSKIGAVNAAIEELIPALKDVSDENPDAIIKVAVLEFSSGFRWITQNGPVEVDKFHWTYIDAAGTTDLGAACRELDAKLSRKAFMQEAAGSFAPVIFLLSDGGPTDDFAGGLAVLQQNSWYKVAGRVAIAIGDDADKDVLEQFTGTSETVLEVHDAKTLKRLINMVAVRSSQIASRSSNVGDTGKNIVDDPNDPLGPGLDLTPILSDPDIITITNPDPKNTTIPEPEW